MEFDWDDPNDREGNLWHILSQHPEMKTSRFIEEVFNTPSGDEVFYADTRGHKSFTVVEKTFRRRLYRIVFQNEGGHVQITTAFPISRRRR